MLATFICRINMAQSPDVQVNNDVVMIGFICPVCYHDLKTYEQLHDHFEQNHSDQDVLQMFKDFFGKAKRKILKQDSESDESANKPEGSNSSYQDSSPNVFDYFSDYQEIGFTVSHTKDFLLTRDKKIDKYDKQTNKLLITLDKLISEAPDDPEKRKAFEKHVVPWVSDADVKLCPGCAKSFGLSRRHHHCRLCGGIMCQNCSHFIDFHFARRLIRRTEEDTKFPGSSASTLQRRGSNTSLLSIVSPTGEPHLRICQDCRVLLIRRNQQIDDQYYRPAITQKYERLRVYMDEIDKLSPLYVKMIESLCSGETSYHLHDARELKMKLSKLAEGIDAVSKAISNLPSEDKEEEEVSSKSKQLQSSIRMSAIQFLKQTILGLPQLPSEDEVTRFRKLREDQIKKKVQLEKEAEILAINKNSPSEKSLRNETRSSANRNREARSPVSIESGWSASPGNIQEGGEHEHPLIQQMNIIRKYIAQARVDHRYDELQMLESNLKELEAEYERERLEALT